MFARFTQSAKPLAQNVRRYATEAGAAPKKPNNGLFYGGLAAVVGAAGYYYLSSGAGAADASKPRAHVFKGTDAGWVPLKLQWAEDISPNAKHLRFAFDDPEAISGMFTASALLTKFKGPDDKAPTIRPYTSVSDESQPGYLDLVIKRYPNGPMSNHIHSLKPGDTLDFKGPLPKYPWEANKHKEIALIAGGTGITPMYQLTRKILSNPEDKTKITLVYGNVNEDDILLRKELSELENTYPQRFKVFHLLDNPPENWTQGKGHVTKELLKTVLPEPKSENIKLFVCGPPGMYKAVSGTKVSPKDQGELTGILKELGYEKDQVFKF
ncbi:NADH-cytochrome b5 reductase [Ascosphaera apis ARSEF 7405]|uniref:NADH-cytochrome b5 reductase n=1 Tax=Ascosphaera apis ARSEF 7405 TaxID=392613 RepID=A0A168DMI2_9EURO|nr:NADH-cytochrome b5 reductase [Ascosphaera apis ARSEF 7405]